jgi:hypothetical protein
MAFPTAAQLKNTFLLKYESKINQDSPLNDKAFLRLSSAIWATIGVLIQKETIRSQRENLAITASRAGLIRIGTEYSLPIKDEVTTVLNVTLPATTGVQIPAGTNFVGDDNGILYFDSSTVVSVAGVATLQLTSRAPGVIGNLAAAQTLTMSRNIAGAEQIATITSIETTGADAEETEDYRQRVLDKIRAPGGGGNAADFRNWAGSQEGVRRAYPYSGVAFGDPLFPGGEPPDRSVYIESTTAIDSDGIAPPSLIADTRTTIITDPDTGLHRQPLGLTNDTLYTLSIRRVEVFVEIRNATFLVGTEAAVKAEIDIAVTNYFLSLEPFIQGLDIDSGRNDLVTDLSISETVQDVLKSNSASAEGIGFGLIPGSFLPSYQLGQGEKTKSGGVSYL